MGYATLGTTGAIQAARIVIEKHCKKYRLLYIASLDLEKAFDCAPHKFI